MQANAVTPRQLLDLRPGARLLVCLRSGRSVEAELLGNPYLTSTGKPGLGRVQLTVLDVEHAARVAAREPKRTAFGSNPFGMAAAKHTVSGLQVIEVRS